MKALACAAVLLAAALGMSGCASSHAAHQHSSTDAIQLHVHGYSSLSPPVRNYVHSLIRDGSPDGPVNEIDIYGPASREALVEASSGDWTYVSQRESKLHFYLIVLHGQFVCRGCSGAAGHKPPHGTIETHVWSPSEGGTDFGIGPSLPVAVSHLNRLAVITIS